MSLNSPEASRDDSFIYIMILSNDFYKILLNINIAKEAAYAASFVSSINL